MRAKSVTRMRIGIVMALDQLCKIKPFSEITIDEICEEAGVARSTFYRTFDSKFAIPIWYQNLVLKASIGMVGGTLDWYGAHVASQSGWLLFKHMNAAAKEYRGAESTISNWHKQSRELLVETLRDYKGLEIDDNLYFQAEFFSAVVWTQGFEWDEYLGNKQPEDYTTLFSRCVPHDLYEALNSPDNPNPNATLSLSSIIALIDCCEY